MALKSSHKLAHQVLGVMPTSKVEEALLNWANLPGFFRGVRGPAGPLKQSGGMWIRENALERSLPVVFGQKPSDVVPAFRRMIKLYPEFFQQQGLPLPEKQAFDLLAMVAQLLRMAWDSESIRKQEWYLADIESFYHQALNRIGDPPTYALPLETLVSISAATPTGRFTARIRIVPPRTSFAKKKDRNPAQPNARSGRVESPRGDGGMRTGQRRGSCKSRDGHSFKSVVVNQKENTCNDDDKESRQEPSSSSLGVGICGTGKRE